MSYYVSASPRKTQRKTQEEAQENKKCKNVYIGMTRSLSTFTISQPISIGRTTYSLTAFSISTS